MDRRCRAKLNIPMCCAAVLLCLTLISCRLCGGLYARYSGAGDGEDGARVAKFDVSAESTYFSEPLLMEMTAPGKIQKEIVVTNNSEVAFACTVTLENTTQNIPYLFSVEDSEPTANECSVTCYLEPNSGDNVIEIVMEWEEADALRYMGMADLVELTVSAQQVD